MTIEGDDGERKILNGGLVVNCTGPQAGFSSGTDPLFRNLMERGLVRADELDMGIEVDSGFAAVGRDGRT